MASIRSQIEDKLKKALKPDELSVTDESAAHAGHSGARPGGETHFSVEITCAVFSGLSRINRHRLINQVLSEELSGPVHALAIKAKALGE